MSIDELIANLEAATEGSLRLDAMIAACLLYHSRDSVCTVDGLVFERSSDGRWIYVGAAAPYSINIHIALSIETTKWTAIEMRSRHGRRAWTVDLSRMSADGLTEEFVTGTAPTLPLAICLAKARARKAEANGPMEKRA